MIRSFDAFLGLSVSLLYLLTPQLLHPFIIYVHCVCALMYFLQEMFIAPYTQNKYSEIAALSHLLAAFFHWWLTSPHANLIICWTINWFLLIHCFENVRQVVGSMDFFTRLGYGFNLMLVMYCNVHLGACVFFLQLATREWMCTNTIIS